MSANLGSGERQRDIAPGVMVRVLSACLSQDAGFLNLERGDFLEVEEVPHESLWAKGKKQGTRTESGWFPIGNVEVCPSPMQIMRPGNGYLSPTSPTQVSRGFGGQSVPLYAPYGQQQILFPPARNNTQSEMGQGDIFAEPLPQQPADDGLTYATTNQQNQARSRSPASISIECVCGKILSGSHARGNFTRHLKSEGCTTSGLERTRHHCTATGCDKNYARSDGLGQHMRNKHPELVQAMTEGKANWAF
ncbi:hypothetical protein P154DRAFT_231150 [Amniculicola lignicola CBS 123094]|uniref:C2H2-type domain-containing protein n=1 Tax=Amniculicola lignicola CBS 123094 TaxID=1392246 RepID=A0A6A5WGU9_9PLEO|nr:hypothetical protein P154DRAFT_231150 [Amniculicola lignicola CBS 123094]